MTEVFKIVKVVDNKQQMQNCWWLYHAMPELQGTQARGRPG